MHERNGCMPAAGKGFQINEMAEFPDTKCFIPTAWKYSIFV